MTTVLHPTFGKYGSRKMCNSDAFLTLKRAILDTAREPEYCPTTNRRIVQSKEKTKEREKKREGGGGKLRHACITQS